jgi:hypothetical protein
MDEQVNPQILDAILAIPYVGPYIPIVGSVILAAKTITPWIDTRDDNPWLNGLKWCLNFLALNYGKDRNMDDLQKL